MKTMKIYSALAGIAMAATLAGCEGEKDLIIIEGNLPVKTSVLYMVGDATPNGWSIDDPTPFAPTEDDALVFTWEGTLNPGEMKLCISTGSWDAAFIRPETAGEEIGKGGIASAPFRMYAGDPDDKWKVVDAGVYSLTFDLRNWTMSASYLQAPPAPEIEPISAEALYIVGDATPAGWNIDAPQQLEKTSTYVFVYEGALNSGDFKACTQTGSWYVQFIRPSSDGCPVGKSGVGSSDFIYTVNPDNKWHVEEAGVYRITFDLEHWTISSEYVGGIEAGEKEPIETSTLFMIGDATPGGWSMDDATEFSVSADNKYIFTWEGELVEGSMKACIERDGTFSCPFLRPEYGGCEIGASGVASPEFVYTTNPDDQWRITEAGRYRITFDLENYTISAEKL